MTILLLEMGKMDLKLKMYGGKQIISFKKNCSNKIIYTGVIAEVQTVV
jgi:hypothetical protein